MSGVNAPRPPPPAPPPPPLQQPIQQLTHEEVLKQLADFLKQHASVLPVAVAGEAIQNPGEATGEPKKKRKRS